MTKKRKTDLNAYDVGAVIFVDVENQAEKKFVVHNDDGGVKVLLCHTCNQICKHASRHTKSVCDKQMKRFRKNGSITLPDSRPESSNRVVVNHDQATTAFLRPPINKGERDDDDDDDEEEDDYGENVAHQPNEEDVIERNENIDEDEEDEDEEVLLDREQRENADKRHLQDMDVEEAELVDEDEDEGVVQIKKNTKKDWMGMESMTWEQWEINMANEHSGKVTDRTEMETREDLEKYLGSREGGYVEVCFRDPCEDSREYKGKSNKIVSLTVKGPLKSHISFWAYEIIWTDQICDSIVRLPKYMRLQEARGNAPPNRVAVMPTEKKFNDRATQCDALLPLEETLVQQKFTSGMSENMMKVVIDSALQTAMDVSVRVACSSECDEEKKASIAERARNAFKEHHCRFTKPADLNRACQNLSGTKYKEKTVSVDGIEFKYSVVEENESLIALRKLSMNTTYYGPYQPIDDNKNREFSAFSSGDLLYELQSQEDDDTFVLPLYVGVDGAAFRNGKDQGGSFKAINVQIAHHPSAFFALGFIYDVEDQLYKIDFENKYRQRHSDRKVTDAEISKESRNTKVLAYQKIMLDVLGPIIEAMEVKDSRWLPVMIDKHGGSRCVRPALCGVLVDIPEANMWAGKTQNHSNMRRLATREQNFLCEGHFGFKSGDILTRTFMHMREMQHKASTNSSWADKLMYGCNMINAKEDMFRRETSLMARLHDEKVRVNPYTLFVTDALHIKGGIVHLLLMDLLGDYIKHKSQMKTNDLKGQHCVNVFAKVLDRLTKKETYYRHLRIPNKGLSGAVKAYTSYEWSALMKVIGPLLGAVDWEHVFSSLRDDGDDCITSQEAQLLFAVSPEEQKKLREMAAAPQDESITKRAYNKKAPPTAELTEIAAAKKREKENIERARQLKREKRNEKATEKDARLGTWMQVASAFVTVGKWLTALERRVHTYESLKKLDDLSKDVLKSLLAAFGTEAFRRQAKIGMILHFVEDMLKHGAATNFSTESSEHHNMSLRQVAGSTHGQSVMARTQMMENKIGMIITHVLKESKEKTVNVTSERVNEKIFRIMRRTADGVAFQTGHSGSSGWIPIGKLCTNGYQSKMWDQGALLKFARTIVQTFGRELLSKTEGYLNRTEILEANGIKLDGLGDGIGTGETIVVCASKSIHVQLPHHHTGEAAKIHARDKYDNSKDVYSFLEYRNESDAPGVFRYGRARTIFTTIMKKNSGGNDENDNSNGDDNDAPICKGKTYVFVRCLERDGTRNTILGYTGASGPETYEIFRWKSLNPRTKYELIPANSIVRVLRATPFKAKDIAAGAGVKNDDEIILINYLV